MVHCFTNTKELRLFEMWENHMFLFGKHGGGEEAGHTRTNTKAKKTIFFEAIFLFVLLRVAETDNTKHSRHACRIHCQKISLGSSFLG
jgi:hypothetical protein